MLYVIYANYFKDVFIRQWLMKSLYATCMGSILLYPSKAGFIETMNMLPSMFFALLGRRPTMFSSSTPVLRCLPILHLRASAEVDACPTTVLVSHHHVPLALIGGFISSPTEEGEGRDPRNIIPWFRGSKFKNNRNLQLIKKKTIRSRLTCIFYRVSPELIFNNFKQ